MRHTAAGHGGHRSMVRTAVCGAADEGSIPSGHPTRRSKGIALAVSLIDPHGGSPPTCDDLTIVSEFTSSSKGRPIKYPHHPWILGSAPRCRRYLK